MRIFLGSMLMVVGCLVIFSSLPVAAQSKNIEIAAGTPEDKDLQAITGGGRFLFPSLRGSDRPISDNTVNAALRRLGYSSDEMTGHGFRTMASTLLNELGWNPDAIERQLAHDERDDSRASYNHAQYLAERRKMMQAWADYLDTLRSARTPALIDSSTAFAPLQPRAA